LNNINAQVFENTTEVGKYQLTIYISILIHHV
jgi:hypothetical protein